MKNPGDTIESVSDQKGSPATGEIEEQLACPGAYPLSPRSPSSLGTFEKISLLKVPVIVITDEDQQQVEDYREDELMEEGESSDDSAETPVPSLEDPDESDYDEGEARSHWSESSSEDGYSDYEPGYSGKAIYEEANGDGDSFISFPALDEELMQSAFPDVEMGNLDEKKAEDTTSGMEGLVSEVEAEYSEPWWRPLPRWAWLRSSNTFPLYNLGPRDLRHGPSKLRQTSSTDDIELDDMRSSISEEVESERIESEKMMTAAGAYW